VSNSVNFPVRLVLGANDSVFFLMTRGAAEQVLVTGATLENDVTFQAAGKYTLPNPTSVWYSNGQGMILTSGVNPVTIGTMLALTSGPAIGSMFEGIVTDLSNESAVASGTQPLPTPIPVPVTSPEQIEQMVRLLEYALETLESGTISATVTDDGVTLLRFVMTINR
jgi:hypothetical protein